jgi:hypothetical protein
MTALESEWLDLVIFDQIEAAKKSLPASWWRQFGATALSAEVRAIAVERADGIECGFERGEVC